MDASAADVFSREAYTSRQKGRLRHQQEKHLDSTKMWILSLPQNKLDLRCHSLASVKVDEFFHSTLYFQWCVRRLRKGLVGTISDDDSEWPILIFEYMMAASGRKPLSTYNLTDQQILLDAKDTFGVIDGRLSFPNLKPNGMLEHGMSAHRPSDAGGQAKDEMRCWIHRISRDSDTIFETCRNEGLQFHSPPKDVVTGGKLSSATGAEGQDHLNSAQATPTPTPTVNEDKPMTQSDCAQDETSTLIHPIELSSEAADSDILKRIDEIAQIVAGIEVPSGVGAASSLPDERVKTYKDVCKDISAAIANGAPIYDRGDHKGCHDIYKEVAKTILQCCSLVGVRKELRSALDMAEKQSTFTKQAWTLRHAFDAILSGDIDTSDFTDKDKEEVIVQPMGYKDACVEISAAISRGGPTYDSGNHSGCYAIYKRTAERIVESCSLLVVRQKLRKALDLASSQSNSTDRAWTLRSSFDNILRGAFIIVADPDEDEDPPIADEVAEKSMSYQDACREISMAISKGAPTYNSGDHEGCYNTYKQTADKILEECKVEGVCRELRSAFEAVAKQLDPTKCAWTMRHAFDAILHGHIDEENLGGSVRLSREELLLSQLLGRRGTL